MARARRRQRIGAAIDIGSYSVHLLVAEIYGHRLVGLHDESAFLGLGRSVDADGALGPAAAQLIDTLAAFAGRARDLGAPTVTMVGTDPLRRAADASKVVADVRATAGVEPVIVTHEQEALLALLGVQAGAMVDRETVMVDVGGGSTEVLVAKPSQGLQAIGLPLGAARLTGAHVQSDPPTNAEIRALREASTAAFEDAPMPTRPSSLPSAARPAASFVSGRGSRTGSSDAPDRALAGHHPAAPAIAVADRLRRPAVPRPRARGGCRDPRRGAAPLPPRSPARRRGRPA